jgi:hypothetical protein
MWDVYIHAFLSLSNDRANENYQIVDNETSSIIISITLHAIHSSEQAELACPAVFLLGATR